MSSLTSATAGEGGGAVEAHPVTGWRDGDQGGARDDGEHGETVTERE
jgi:hypothetical protein